MTSAEAIRYQTEEELRTRLREALQSMGRQAEMGSAWTEFCARAFSSTLPTPFVMSDYLDELRKRKE